MSLSLSLVGLSHGVLGGLDLYPLQLSFAVAGAATALSLLLGVAVAALLARGRFPGRDLLDAALSLPLVLPPTVLGYYLLVLLSQHSPLGRALTALLGTPLTFTPAGAVLAATLHALPLLSKSARAAIEGVDPLLQRAARSLGASEWRVLFTVTLPLCKRGVAAAAVLAFARALGDFGLTLMIAGDIPGSTQTAALAIYDAMQAGRDRDALVLVLLLSGLALLALYAANRLTRGR